MSRTSTCPLIPWLLSALGVLVGCDASDPADNVFVPKPREVTYTQDIQPLLADACSDCHGPQSTLPLDTYEAAAQWSDAIADVVLGQQPHLYMGLSPDEDEMLLAWDEAGAPVGVASIPAGGAE